MAITGDGGAVEFHHTSYGEVRRQLGRATLGVVHGQETLVGHHFENHLRRLERRQFAVGSELPWPVQHPLGDGASVDAAGGLVMD